MTRPMNSNAGEFANAIVVHALAKQSKLGDKQESERQHWGLNAMSG